MGKGGERDREGGKGEWEGRHIGHGTGRRGAIAPNFNSWRRHC